MTVEVTLTLSENLIEQAKRLGLATQRDVNSVLTDVLEMLWLTVEEEKNLTASPALELSDEVVLALADAKMDEKQNQRLGELQAKGKAQGLTDAERYELLALGCALEKCGISG